MRHPKGIEYENLAALNGPYLAELERAAVDAIRGGWYVLGERVSGFEEAFARYCGAGHCVGVASGLDALLLALKALDLPNGSEVIVPSNTYIATILAILQAGHRPVLVEPDIRTYNIDPAQIEDAITPRTRALMIVHLYGKPCEMDSIQEICHRRSLALVEDCAQSHGAKFRGKMTGTFGIGAFSFYPTKNLGAFGDAGAVVTMDPKIAETVRSLRNYGSKAKYYNELVGYNSRLDELQAALLSVKLPYLDSVNSHKRELAKIYLESLTDNVIKPVTDSRLEESYHIFCIRTERRDELRAFLASRNVKTEVHYPVSPSRQAAMKGILDHVAYPISEEIHRTVLSLPISTIHAPDDVRHVAETVNEFFGAR